MQHSHCQTPDIKRLWTIFQTQCTCRAIITLVPIKNNNIQTCQPATNHHLTWMLHSMRVTRYTKLTSLYWSVWPAADYIGHMYRGVMQSAQPMGHPGGPGGPAPFQAADYNLVGPLISQEWFNICDDQHILATYSSKHHTPYRHCWIILLIKYSFCGTVCLVWHPPHGLTTTLCPLLFITSTGLVAPKSPCVN